MSNIFYAFSGDSIVIHNNFVILHFFFNLNVCNTSGNDIFTVWKYLKFCTLKDSYNYKTSFVIFLIILCQKMACSKICSRLTSSSKKSFRTSCLHKVNKYPQAKHAKVKRNHSNARSWFKLYLNLSNCAWSLYFVVGVYTKTIRQLGLVVHGK
jgi:arginine utilization protein RocB